MIFFYVALQTRHLQELFEKNITADVQAFYELFQRPISNTTVHDILVKETDFMMDEVNRMVHKLQEVTNRTAEIDLTDVANETKFYEFIRYGRNVVYN